MNIKKIFIASFSILLLGKANPGLLILIQTILCTLTQIAGTLLHQNNSSWEEKGKLWTHLFEGGIQTFQLSYHVETHSCIYNVYSTLSIDQETKANP